MNDNIKQELEKIFNVQLKENSFKQLVHYIQSLIQSDFEKLIFLLYKIDVSENNLKKILHQNTNTNTAEIIAAMIVERLEEKIKTKQSFKPNTIVDDEEKW